MSHQAIKEAVHQYVAHVHGDVDFEALTDDEQHAAYVATDDILEAALPHLREQIAQEIEATPVNQLTRPFRGLGANTVRVVGAVRINAARIVRGEP